MKVGFRESFLKDLVRVKDKRLLQRVRATIESVEKVGSLERLPGLKKLKGGGSFYCLRIGDFRAGLFVDGDRVIFVRLINRKDIYRYFP